MSAQVEEVTASTLALARLADVLNKQPPLFRLGSGDAPIDSISETQDWDAEDEGLAV